MTQSADSAVREAAAKALFEFERVPASSGGRKCPAWEHQLPEFQEHMRRKIDVVASALASPEAPGAVDENAASAGKITAPFTEGDALLNSGMVSSTHQISTPPAPQGTATLVCSSYHSRFFNGICQNCGRAAGAHRISTEPMNTTGLRQTSCSEEASFTADDRLAETQAIPSRPVVQFEPDREAVTDEMVRAFDRRVAEMMIGDRLPLRYVREGLKAALSQSPTPAKEDGR